MRATSNHRISRCFFLRWTDSVGKSLLVSCLEDNNLVAGILEVKLQFLLSELGLTIDTQLEIIDIYLCSQLCKASPPAENRSD